MGLRLSANYAYTKCECKAFELRNNSANLFVDCTGETIAQGNIGRYDCAPFQFTPENQAALTASYGFVTNPAVGIINGSVTYAWTDERYSSSYSLPDQELGLLPVIYIR